MQVYITRQSPTWLAKKRLNWLVSYNWPRIYMKKSWLSNILNTNVEVLWFFDFEGWKFEKKFQGWAIKLSIKPTYVKYSRFQEFITRVSTGVKLSFWFLIAYFRLDRWRPYQPLCWFRLKKYDARYLWINDPGTIKMSQKFKLIEKTAGFDG